MKLETVIKELNLKPHPEGGYFCETYRSAETIGSSALPGRYGGDRAFGTSIFYLLNGHDKSYFHRLKSDELWYFHLGAAIVLHVIDPQQGYYPVELGPDLTKIGAKRNKEYLRQAILDPEAVIAKGFSGGMMPPTYGEQMKAKELEMLVNYLAGLK